jgi:hypothetical protein
MTLHHHGGKPHPTPAISSSLLRFSALQQLALAGSLIVLIWAVALWATR